MIHNYVMTNTKLVHKLDMQKLDRLHNSPMMLCNTCSQHALSFVPFKLKTNYMNLPLSNKMVMGLGSIKVTNNIPVQLMTNE